MSTSHRLLDSTYPLLISIPPAKPPPDGIAELIRLYEEAFAKGRRYALLSVTVPGATPMSARDRVRIANWANEPRVRASSKELCVGSATVVSSAVERGALTAILWIWTPASPHLACANVSEGVDFCIERLERAGVRLPMPPNEYRHHALATVDLALRE